MVKSLLCWILPGLLWASGCAGVNSVTTDPGAAGDASVTGSIPEPPEGVAEPIYLMLVGEIAGQRGQFDVALDHYLQLARIDPDVRVAERATQIALYVKDTDKAIEAAKMWSERDPSNHAAHRIMAMLQIKAGNTDDAADELGQLIGLKDPEFENTLIELVKWLDADLPAERSLAIMQEFAEKHPKVPEIHLAYALLASNKGALMVARSETEKALSVRPAWSRALMLRAQLLMQAGDVRAARVSLEKALKSDPGNARLGLLYAQFLAKSGDYPAAERELKRVIGKDPQNHDARFALASVWLELGQYERAKSEFQSLVSDPHWQAQSEFSLGLIEARQGHAESALREFDRVGAGPLEFDARFNAISALIGLGRFDEARLRLAKARDNFPSEKTRLYLIEAEMLNKRSEVAAAFDLLSAALKDAPTQTELLYSRALIAEQLGKLDVMETDLRAVLAAKPDDPSALNALGFSLADHRLDRLDEATNYIKLALEKRPDDPAILDSYGWLLYRKGNRDESLIYLRRAYKLFADPEIAAHLGEVLWETGHRADARRIWSEGFAKNPEQDDIKRVKQKYPEAFPRGTR